MNSYKIKFVTLICIILITGCDIAFKRKTNNASDSQAAMNHPNIDTVNTVSSKKNKSEKNKVETKASFSERDSKLIALYYADKSNAVIVEDMVKQTYISDKQAKKLVISERIPNNTQVMPLPLELEKMLSPLPRYNLRVQVGKHVILMDVKSRQILDMIKI